MRCEGVARCCFEVWLKSAAGHKSGSPQCAETACRLGDEALRITLEIPVLDLGMCEVSRTTLTADLTCLDRSEVRGTCVSSEVKVQSPLPGRVKRCHTLPKNSTVTRTVRWTSSLERPHPERKVQTTCNFPTPLIILALKPCHDTALTTPHSPFITLHDLAFL